MIAKTLAAAALLAAAAFTPATAAPLTPLGQLYRQYATP